jgi:hypothetical protein
VPWPYWQFLDRTSLVERPWESLWCLHAQPPVLNALAAVVAGAERWPGVPEGVTAFLLLLGPALAGLAALFRLARLYGAGRRGAVAACLAFALSPAYLAYSAELFYTFLVMNMLLAASWCAVRAAGGSAGHLAGLAACLLVAVWSRAAWPPVLGIALVAAVAALGGRRGGGWRRGGGGGRRTAALALTAVLVALMVAWPVKNRLVFGTAVNSSWAGFNLARGTDVPLGPVLGPYLDRAEVPAGGSVTMAGAAFAGSAFARICREAPVVTATSRDQPGTRLELHRRNWNHWVFLDSGAALEEAGRAWLGAHLGLVPRRAVQYAAIAGLPSEASSFDGKPYGLSPAGSAWSRMARALPFADLRPWLEPLPVFAALGEAARPWAAFVPPWTLYGVAILPLTLAVAVVAGWRWLPDPRGVGLLFMAVLMAANLGIPILTDGAEVNRMSFETSGPAWLLCVFLLVRLRDMVRGSVLARSYAQANVCL